SEFRPWHRPRAGAVRRVLPLHDDGLAHPSGCQGRSLVLGQAARRVGAAGVISPARGGVGGSSPGAPDDRRTMGRGTPATRLSVLPREPVADPSRSAQVASQGEGLAVVVKGIKWVGTCAGDWDTAVAFYRDVLGLSVRSEGWLSGAQGVRCAELALPNGDFV